MKIVHVVGARTNFTKVAPTIDALDDRPAQGGAPIYALPRRHRLKQR